MIRFTYTLIISFVFLITLHSCGTEVGNGNKETQESASDRTGHAEGGQDGIQKKSNNEAYDSKVEISNISRIKKAIALLTSSCMNVDSYVDFPIILHAKLNNESIDQSLEISLVKQNEFKTSLNNIDYIFKRNESTIEVSSISTDQIEPHIILYSWSCSTDTPPVSQSAEDQITETSQTIFDAEKIEYTSKVIAKNRILQSYGIYLEDVIYIEFENHKD